jgi:hypothetical protein
MTRFFRIFIALTVLVLTSFAVPAAAVPDLPTIGTVAGVHGPPDFGAPGCPAWAVRRFSSHGLGTMSRLGRVEYSLTQCTVPGPVNSSEGTITLVAANGDELHLEHTMLSQMVFGDAGPVGFTFVGTWEAEEELKPLVGARRALARPRPHPGPNRFAMSVGRGRVRSVRTPVRLA